MIDLPKIVHYKSVRKAVPGFFNEIQYLYTSYNSPSSLPCAKYNVVSAHNSKV